MRRLDLPLEVDRTDVWEDLRNYLLVDAVVDLEHARVPERLVVLGAALGRGGEVSLPNEALERPE